MKNLKALTQKDKQEFWELVRYVVAGALTTAVSLIVSYGVYFLFAVNYAAESPEVLNGIADYAAWIIAVINSASALHITIGNVISWIFAVIFAFWINRRMVFRVRYYGWDPRIKAFLQFVSARVVSLLLFEMGLAALLNVLGVPNLLGRVLVLILVMVFNYVASKFWIFKKPQGDGAKEK